MRYSFWMVWHSGGNPPRVKHTTPESAEREAARLARANPGEEFIVMRAEKAVRTEVNPVSVVELAEPIDLPF